MSSRRLSLRKGYDKISATCQLARRQGLKYVWVDTCCIDKSSSAEITESINSMFQWYKDAAVCYVYLEDLEPNSVSEEALAQCRWFTRGWTLQELIAPENVEFYDVAWGFKGTRVDFVDAISVITKIPKEVLLSEISISMYSVAQRMSWAAQRRTTRIEDSSYCLFGIFDVNLPLIYGEGAKAFLRLQEQIIKRSNDLTILAWQEDSPRTSGLFASSPEGFACSSSIIPLSQESPEFSITNKGLLLSEVRLKPISTKSNSSQRTDRYLLELGRSQMNFSAYGGISLRKIGPKLLYRDWNRPLVGFGITDFELFGRGVDESGCYIVIDPVPSSIEKVSSTMRHDALHVPLDDVFTLTDAVPEDLWDISDRVFLRPKSVAWARYDMVLSMMIRGRIAGRTFDFVILCDYRVATIGPMCRVFKRGDFERQESKIFRGRNRSQSIDWTELEIDAQGITALSNFVDVRVNDRKYRVEVSCEHERVSYNEVYSMKFSISEV